MDAFKFKQNFHLSVIILLVYLNLEICGSHLSSDTVDQLSLNNSSLSSNSTAAHDLLVTQVEAHVRRLKDSFPCRDPQPYVMDASDAVPMYQPHMLLFPHQTAVKRCGIHTGCCPQGNVCQPKEVEMISVTFRVANVFSRNDTFVIALLENHLECVCKRPPRIIPSLERKP